MFLVKFLNGLDGFLAKLKGCRFHWRNPKQFILRHRDLITVFSEALAAVGIIAAGTSFTYDSWQARRVSLSGAVIYSTPSQISLFVSNDGGKDLVITGISLHSGVDIESFVKIDPKGLLVEKGKSAILSSDQSKLNSTVKYQAPEDGEEPLFRSTSTPCMALINYVVAGGEAKTATVDFQCYAATLFDPDELQRLYNMVSPKS